MDRGANDEVDGEFAASCNYDWIRRCGRVVEGCLRLLKVGTYVPSMYLCRPDGPNVEV